MDTHRTLRTAILGIALVVGAAATGFADDTNRTSLGRSQTLEDYRAHADQLLASFGPGLLQTPDGPDWMANLNTDQVATAVSDFPPPDLVETSGPYTVARDAEDTKFVKIHRNHGRVRWANKGHRFSLATTPHVAVSEAVAEQVAISVCNALGLPVGEREEIITKRIAIRAEDPQAAIQDADVEQLVTLQRHVAGVYVHDSRVRISVSNLGEAGRLLVQWPRFALTEGLALRTRDAVLDDIAQRVWDVEFGETVEMGIRIVYARVGATYVPAARIGFAGLGMGHIEIIPLVDIGDDADQDGVQDAADNCPDRRNRDQADEDGDGVGNPCDNCPETYNPAQVDTDHDGIGNACEEARGACRFGDGTCDETSAADCAAAGGVYEGDGTDCLTALDAPDVGGGRNGSGAIRLDIRPNPTRAAATVHFTLEEEALGPVEIVVHDAAGRRVRTLFSQIVREAGGYSVSWDGRDGSGRESAAGVYFVRVNTEAGERVKKVTLLR